MMRHIGLCPRPVIGGPQLAPDGLEPALYGAKVADRLARLPRIVHADEGDQFHDPAALYGDAPVDERLRHAQARILDDVERHPRVVEFQRQRRTARLRELGGASCRERVCQYVEIGVDAVSFKTEKITKT